MITFLTKPDDTYREDNVNALDVITENYIIRIRINGVLIINKKTHKEVSDTQLDLT